MLVFNANDIFPNVCHLASIPLGYTKMADKNIFIIFQSG